MRVRIREFIEDAYLIVFALVVAALVVSLIQLGMAI